MIGVIRGREEPDSWVILGNHYDAWTFGSMNPNSGTAILAEIARVFAAAAQRGWRPRRSLVFGAWDGEEPGLIGFVDSIVGIIWSHSDQTSSRALHYANFTIFGPSTFAFCFASSYICFVLHYMTQESYFSAFLMKIWHKNIVKKNF